MADPPNCFRSGPFFSLANSSSRTLVAVCLGLLFYLSSYVSLSLRVACLALIKRIPLPRSVYDMTDWMLLCFYLTQTPLKLVP